MIRSMLVAVATIAAVLLATGPASAGIVEFDHIGELPSPHTGNLNGAFMFDSGVLSHEWRRSGVRWTQSQDSQLESASFVVFIASSSVTNIDNSIFNIHFWNGFANSFAVEPVSGDFVIQGVGLPRTITPFTTVGPTGTEFQTFKVTYDFTQLATPINLNAAQEYVMAPVAVFGGQFRLSFSNATGGLVDVGASGTDNTFNQAPALLSDILAGPTQFGVSLTVIPVPEPASWVLAAIGASSVAVILRRKRRQSKARLDSDSPLLRRGS